MMFELRIGSSKKKERAQESSMNKYILNEIKSCEDAALNLIVINLTLIGIFLVFIMNIQSIESIRTILGAKLYPTSQIKIIMCASFIVWGAGIISSYLAFIRRGVNIQFMNEEYKLFIFFEKILNHKRILLTISYIFMVIGFFLILIPVYHILPYQLNGIVETWEILGDDLLDQNRYKDAIGYYDLVIKTSPENISARIKKACALEESGDLPGALACYDQIITDLDEENITAWLKKSNILCNLSDFPGALECCDKILNDLNPNCEEALVIKSSISLKMRNYADAINASNEAITINDQNIKAWLYKGHALWNQNDFNQALECYLKTTEIDPQFGDGWYHVYLALDRLDRIPESNEALEKARRFESFVGKR